MIRKKDLQEDILKIIEGMSESLVSGLPELFDWLGIRANGYVYVSNSYDYPLRPCLQQQIDAICEHLGIKIETVAPPSKERVVATKKRPVKKTKKK